MTAPGWYPDPQDQRFLRWWDGEQWTPHTHPAEASTPASSAPQGLVQQRVPAGGANASQAPELTAAIDQLRSEYARLKEQVIETSSIALLQEVGIYQYRHRLQDAAAYKERLDDLLTRIRDMAKRDGAAVQSGVGWAINGSAAEGAKMVKDLGKLMLRSYNNEADNIVQTMRPYTVDTATKRLEKSRDTVSKLGASLKITITGAYHTLRVEELHLTADFLQKQEEEKAERRERLRQEREKRADDEQARLEIEREQERCEKERAHYQNLLIAARANADRAAIDKAEAKIEEIDTAAENLEKRAANTRAGWVYVISNIGAFGEGVVKIGLTRRLDPTERVQELGGASVPFGFDVHGFLFSDDAVGLEGGEADRSHHVVRLPPAREQMGDDREAAVFADRTSAACVRTRLRAVHAGACSCRRAPCGAMRVRPAVLGTRARRRPALTPSLSVCPSSRSNVPTMRPTPQQSAARTRRGRGG